READWIANSVDLSTVSVVLSGAGGVPQMDPMYEAVIANLTRRAGRTLEHQTYKQFCGENPAASAFGFATAVSLVRQRRCAVLLLTLSARGFKSICCLQP
ncbi:MAG TPA: hypothetical protein VFC07_14585, partial [Verrucomicrobiae bacterium]|nr:hypothetical protein [Verrucomicrobiae bacterium]